MTQEEKAKAYDEALKQIKECVPDDNGFITIYPQEIFPELAESEDERIRKELLAFCKNRAEKYPDDPKYKNISAWIAWLEKQAEQKSTEWSDEDEIMLYRIGGWLDTLCDYLRDSSPDCIYDVHKSYSWLKSLKERVQPKQEWSEEDENRLSDAVFFVREYQIPTRDKRLLNAAKEAEEWLKSLKERYTWKPSDEYIGMQNEIARLKAKLRDFGCEL